MPPPATRLRPRRRTWPATGPRRRSSSKRRNASRPCATRWPSTGRRWDSGSRRCKSPSRWPRSYVLSTVDRTTLPDPLVATTIVSSSMLGEIAKAEGARYAETLTGFKWLVRAGEGLVFAYEEALGLCVNPGFVRDKDGIAAATLAAGLAAQLKAAGPHAAGRARRAGTAPRRPPHRPGFAAGHGSRGPRPADGEGAGDPAVRARRRRGRASKTCCRTPTCCG